MAKNPHYFSHLAHVEVLTTDLSLSVQFFRDVVGMDETGRTQESVYLRAWGDYYHHTLKLTQSDKSGLGHIGWRADSDVALEEAVAYLESIGAGRGWMDPDLGHGRAYRFQSPDGHMHEVFWEVEWLRETGERGSVYADRYSSNRLKGANPRRIDHITYMVAKGKYQQEKEFWTQLGLKNPDEIRIADDIPPIGGLWTIGNLSHDIAIFTDPNIQENEAVLNHICWNVDSREEVLLALDYFIEKGFKSVMGAPTRHKADEGFFIYIVDPGSGILFEYYACARLVFGPDHQDIHYLKDNPNDAWGSANPFAEMAKGKKLGLTDGVVKPVDI